MPRVPPVTTATRCCRDNLPPPRKACQYSRTLCPALVPPLSQPRDNQRHIIGLLGRACPLLGCPHQGLRQDLRDGVAMAQGDLQHALDAELFPVNVFWFGHPIAIGQQQASWLDLKNALLIGAIIENSNDHAAFLEFTYLFADQAERRQVAGIGVVQRARARVVDGVKERAEPVAPAPPARWRVRFPTAGAGAAPR